MFLSPLTMLYMLLPFPFAFLFHDFEEVAVQHKWIKAHQRNLIKRFPLFTEVFESLLNLGTQAFSVAVFEEFMLILAATIYVIADGPYAFHIWAGLYIAFAAHLFMHIGQAFLVHGYVPGLITSVLLLPYAILTCGCIWIPLSGLEFMACSFFGILFCVCNLFLAHNIGKWWVKRSKGL